MMEPAMMSTASALTGTIIGGVTTFTSTWLTRKTQSRAERLTERKAKREDLYGKFLDEAARLLLADGATAPADFVAIRSIELRILLVGSRDVVARAERLLAALEADRVGGASGDGTDARTQLRMFAEACRREIETLRR